MSQTLCQQCKKSLATVHLTEIQGRDKRERHLCDRCAVDAGVSVKQQQHIPVAEWMTNFIMQQSGAQQLSQLKCPLCQLTFAEFRNQGVLGCAHDYDAFGKPLQALIEKAHEGATQHQGKHPRGKKESTADPQREVSRLRRELTTAVENEDFERAAQLRDSLRNLGSE